MASGTVGSTAPADGGSGQADDVNFAAQPESSCAQARVATCTDPNRQILFAPDQAGRRDRAAAPHDALSGAQGLRRVLRLRPPERRQGGERGRRRDDPARGRDHRAGLVRSGQPGRHARWPSAATWAPARPTAAASRSRRASSPTTRSRRPATSAQCRRASATATTVHTRPYGGTLGLVDVARLKASFPPLDFTGNANGGLLQDSNGRPNTPPYAFTVRVVVTTATGTPMSGEDRRQLFLHRDRDLLPRLPRSTRRRRRLLAAARRPRRRQPQRARGRDLRRLGPRLPPQRLRAPRLAGAHRAAAPAPRRGRLRRGGVGSGHYGAVLGALAAGDLFGTGQLDVVADDNQGNVYAWDARGRLVFHRMSRAAYSGAPLTAVSTRCARACATGSSAASSPRPSSDA